jgi:hypothetical protein
MINRTSRYRKTPTLTQVDASGASIELLDLRVIPKTTGIYRLTPTDSDRLDHLAWRFYRDPTRFWRICDASDFLDPLDVLAAGEPVIIPPDK